MSNQNHVEALKRIVALDPEGVRGDDLGLAVRIARAALSAPQEAARYRCSNCKSPLRPGWVCDSCDSEEAEPEEIDSALSAPQEASKPEALELSEDEAAMLRILRQSNVLTGPEKAILTKVLDASKEASKVEPVAEGEPVSEEIAVMLGERVAFLRDPAVYRGKHWPTMTNEQRKRAFAKLDGGAAGFKNHLWAWKHFDMAAEDIGVPASPKALSDADGEAFRKAAELGLTLRFYGGCAQSGMPGSPSVYEVVLGSDRAASMREAVNRAAQAAIGGKA